MTLMRKIHIEIESVCSRYVERKMIYLHTHTHTHTHRYLHMTGHKYGRPIAGQKEVSGISTKSNSNLWRAMVCAFNPFALASLTL